MIPDEALDALRRPLLKFARLQLRDDALAEDVVSETMLALLERPQAFEQRSSLQTYATGILKHKIIDTVRRRRREMSYDENEETSAADAIDALFHADGHWVEPPQPWASPERSLEQRQFFDVLQVCVERLPARLSRVFMMREWLELEPVEICAELEITDGNLRIMLYRARMQLRECLGTGWFSGASA
ncbi:MAG: sigma-70 family RNA polymerase sigma factor [Burkholderiales bacterium]|jgi:RNA polymerase sigma-70 factor (ECF subfamily)